MYSNSVLDFIDIFKPERKAHWENLTEDEKIKISNSPIINEDLVKVLFSPEKYPEKVERMRDRMDDLEFFLQHPDCCYDVYSYRTLWNRVKKAKYDGDADFNFNGKYQEFFKNAEKLPVTFPKGKTARTIYSKIMSNQPVRYKERESVDDDFFGYFMFDGQGEEVVFGSYFEWIIFRSVEQFGLIPYFLEYRRENLLEWIYQALIETESRLKKDEEHLSHLQEMMKVDEKERNYRKRLLRNVVESGKNTQQQVIDYVRPLVYRMFERHGYGVMPVVTERSISYKGKNSLFDITYEFKYSIRNIESELERLEENLE